MRTVWNKGTKGICKPNSGSFKKGEHQSPETQFKKGDFSREKHPFWKGGRRSTVNGYIMVNVPGHPRAYRNEVYEHIIIAEKKIGRYLEKGEVVHHINRKKNDNSPDNLIVFKNNSEHIRNHKLSNYGKWSRNYERCKKCSTNKISHGGLGYCENCYKKLQYARKNNNSNNFLCAM